MMDGITSVVVINIKRYLWKYYTYQRFEVKKSKIWWQNRISAVREDRTRHFLRLSKTVSPKNRQNNDKTTTRLEDTYIPHTNIPVNVTSSSQDVTLRRCWAPRDSRTLHCLLKDPQDASTTKSIQYIPNFPSEVVHLLHRSISRSVTHSLGENWFS